MMRIFRLLAQVLRSRKGNVAVIFALTMPVVIGSAALSVETSYWYYKQHQLQAAADNAAYAGSLENRNGSSSDVIAAAALNVASQNTFDPSLGTITVGTPTTGAYANNPAATQVTLTQQGTRFFTQLFSNAPVIIKANATAMYVNAQDACILALDPSAAQAAYFSGSSALTLNGCVVMSDSNAANGVYVWGAASLTAQCVVSAGGVQQKGGITDTGCATPMTDVQPAHDPYAGLAWPTALANSTCQTTPSSGTIPPGHYCSLDIKNNLTLQTGGQYVFDSITGHGSGSLTGSGVTIFTGSGGIDINGNTTLNLSAPTTGPYAGILFFGDRSASGVTNTFNGTASSVMTGALYFASQSVNYNGNFSGANGCTYVVADTVWFSGNTSMSENCTNYGMAPIPVMASVKLVS